MKMNNKTVLLTGGLGYIGSHTAVEFLKAGYETVIADNLSNSSADIADRLSEITGKAPSVYVCDAADRNALKEIFGKHDIDTVIHFAGLKSVAESVAEPVMYYRTNIDSMLTVLEVMKECGVKKLVFSSSATVYGSSGRTPFSETDPAGDCSNPYGRTKYIIEEMLKDAAAADPEFSAVILRYFNPIGAHPSGLIGELPRGVPNNLMPYITQTAAGIRERLKVFGDDYDTPDGTGIRDFIHVVDLARGHMAAKDYADSHKGAEVFNLGTGKGTSVLELIRTFEEVNKVKIPYEVTERRPGDIAACYADVSKAKNILNWESEYDIADMCRDSWRWELKRNEEFY